MVTFILFVFYHNYSLKRQLDSNQGMKTIQLSGLLCTDVNRGLLLCKGWHVRQTTQRRHKEDFGMTCLTLEFNYRYFSGTVTGLGANPLASVPVVH